MLFLIHLINKQESQRIELEQRVLTLETAKTNVEYIKEDPIVVFVQPVVYENWTEVTETIQLDGQEYLERCVEAEAGNQEELGKRYVCDVVLNRLNWDIYNSIYEVIDDSGQFQCVSNGSINRIVVSDETKRVVQQEIQNRTNSEITFFRTGKYHGGTVPCFKCGEHYFSKKG